MEKRWLLKNDVERSLLTTLSKELGIDPVLSKLLLQRGINTFEKARSFFRPLLDELHDPFLMKDIDIAVDRVIKAINKNEKILIFGDYDVDGTTSVALVYTFLKEIGHANIDFYIPDRYSEGYGISFKSIEYCNATGVNLVIALDCGIKANDKIDIANSHNIDFIICDHHRPGDTLPKAVAILDPKRSDCNYPFKELSGCGVGFKLLQALVTRLNINISKLHKYVDLVTISIAADIVPIVDENRIFAYYGLKQLNTNPRKGVEAILKYANIIHDNENCENGNYFNRELTISDIVFLLGPRINAAGRIDNAKNSVKLLISENFTDAETLAKQINKFNLTRKDLDLTTTEEAIQIIDINNKQKKLYSTVVYDPKWHKGVIGIVASRLVEHYYKPAIVFTSSNGLITGSARSIKDFDIYDAIDSCSHLLKHFGGHKYAAGLSLVPENLQAFIEQFEEIARNNISDNMLIPEIEVDTNISLNEITPKFFRILKQFAPFGPGNMSPIFSTENVIDNGYGKIVGTKHLKLTIGHRDIVSQPFSAIAFQQIEQYKHISNGKPFNICYHIEENHWNGKKEIQINIKDIKPVL